MSVTAVSYPEPTDAWREHLPAWAVIEADKAHPGWRNSFYGSVRDGERIEIYVCEEDRNPFGGVLFFDVDKH